MSEGTGHALTQVPLLSNSKGLLPGSSVTGGSPIIGVYNGKTDHSAMARLLLWLRVPEVH